MSRTVGIGIQDFAKLIEGKYFYIDKTSFIKEWWESGDDVTIITRPRRFGKTLNMNMINRFFSVEYAGQGELFEGLSIWNEDAYRELQGTYPVINLSFASIKETNYQTTREKICQILTNLYIKHSYLRDSEALTDADRLYFDRILSLEIRDSDATVALHQLSDFLYRYYGKKVIILLDEYDTPMQEAYINGFWDELVAFTRSMFNSAFKTNPYLERGLMTGITRISKESIFSDLNNLKVVTTTSDEYATCFGFTEEEVFSALDECGLSEQKDGVKIWYDGFVFGTYSDIYNPWSVLNFLDTNGQYNTYWVNTSGNRLVGKLLREGNQGIKLSFEALLKGETIISPIDEQIVYNRLGDNEAAVWSLLLASGYLKVLHKEKLIRPGMRPKYTLSITNGEVLDMFLNMVHDWFMESEVHYNNFIQALLKNDIEAMNEYMNKLTENVFSYFDTATNPADLEPERFYHGFVLGLLTELEQDYILTSNRESGFDRYDVMLEPRDKGKNAYILEFKVHKPKKDITLEKTVEEALRQIEEKQYETELLARGIIRERIYKYGFAFRGKEVLIGDGISEVGM